jgi:hypothetical protein
MPAWAGAASVDSRDEMVMVGFRKWVSRHAIAQTISRHCIKMEK